jgi:hypothetical protein
MSLRSLGPLVLEANGNYSLGDLLFSQQTAFKNFRICNARFTKAPGEGEELSQ